ncbi:FCD domain-containing protein [Anaerovoracaceae bacterium 42-11]|nr:FCD domain-containing protein [Emergencia sp.]
MEKTELLSKLAFAQYKTQSDYLAEKIKQMITHEEFTDGFVFPNENEFCKILNVSRGTLRDAYKKLDTQGFIERTKHGTYVKCRETIARQGNYSASLELASTPEMLEFISVFEPEAAYLAAQKIDEAGLVKMEELLEACEENADDHDALNTSNYNFHQFIRMQSQNNLVISALTAYYDIFNWSIITTIYLQLKEGANEFRDSALNQHRQLLDAFKAHDGELARTIARDHLQADLKVYAALKEK